MATTLFPHSRVVLELRLGRVAALQEMISGFPQALTTKFPTGLNRQESFLEMAVRMDQTNVALWLLSKGAQETPSSAPNLLNDATLNGNIHLAQLFTQKGWDPWMPVGSLGCPMHQAVAAGNTPLLDMWRLHKVDLKKTDPDTGNNLLHILMHALSHQPVQERSIVLAKWLMAKGVRWDACNATGHHPPDLCAYEKWRQHLTEHWCARRAKNSKKVLAHAVNTTTQSAQISRKKM